MSNDKFTPIHNDVVEALAKINLSPYESRVLWVVFRKTYGFKDKDGKRKKTDWIAYSQITKISNLDKRFISRAMKGLIKKGVIYRDNKCIGFSKEFMKKSPMDSKKKSSVEMTDSVISRDDKESSVEAKPVINFGQRKSSVEMNTKESNTKETNTKDNISKDISSGTKNQTQKPSKENSRKTKSEKPEKEPPQRDPRVTICREYWYEQTEAILKHPYPKNYGKDSSVWKWFLKIYNSVAWAKGLTDFYLKWDNPFVKQCGHSLEAFVKTLPSMMELGTHKSHWVKKHEEGGLKKLSETIKKIFPNGV